MLREDQVAKLLQRVKAVTVEPPLRDYVADIVMAHPHPPRSPARDQHPRHADPARRWPVRSRSATAGRTSSPDDVKSLLVPVLAHRIAVSPGRRARRDHRRGRADGDHRPGSTFPRLRSRRPVKRTSFPLTATGYAVAGGVLVLLVLTALTGYRELLVPVDRRRSS